ncbi:hypothetical protein [Sphingomonas sp. RT2P30]|uniref:hypothetical protein n=1 Tax=Parasphingomonas halimpatiens TaxID=3096162 RepID=UPI002FCB0511
MITRRLLTNIPYHHETLTMKSTAARDKYAVSITFIWLMMLRLTLYFAVWRDSGLTAATGLPPATVIEPVAKERRHVSADGHC